MADSRTNRRRRWLWLFFLPVAVGVTAFFLSRWERGLNIAQCYRVRVGMKRQQVEHILGGPPGDYATRPVARLNPADPTAIADVWITDDGAVLVYYDASGRVTGLGTTGVRRGSPSPLDSVLDRLSSLFF
jgi:hypothetical protein